MAMDAKDLRIESALGVNDDGNSKYGQSGTAFQSSGNKPYDVGSNSLAKVDVPPARPCAIIGPDRVIPPQATNDAYVKKVPVEPWQCTDSIYQHPPDYPHKSTEYQHSRNISPRQTFQENMQRIMVPTSFASVKNSEDHCMKNPKLTPLESKFCDVPYTISPINSDPKLIKSSDGLVLNNNYNQPLLPPGWASNSVNVRPLRPYGASDLYQYSEYANCPGPRPISMIRPHRNVHEDIPQAYQDRFHEANIRFKPYPTTKERPFQNPHSRYDYISNYPNAFQPHLSYPSHKYELQKSIPAHPYSVYPPVHLKYLERRMPVPTMEKYPRSPNQLNLTQPFCNQNVPSTYGPLSANCLQNRPYPYAPDPASKNMIQNRLYFDNHNSRKYYPGSESIFTNDINRPPAIKTDLMYPSYPPINIHSLPPHHLYRKESSMKAYEHAVHYRNLEYSANINPLGRVPLPFPPQTMSISPSDSNTSNDTTQILGTTQDDCGYASQSSTASIKSVESGINRISHDIYRRHEMTLPHMNKFGHKVDTAPGSKGNKGLNVRQFLQMWNEGDDEGNDNNKEPLKLRDSSNSLNGYGSGNNQEQLYVLGLVNVPKEELGKYDHIQKISKLPENIKGYNSIELLNQYEKVVESSLNQFSLSPSQPKQKDLHVPIRNNFPRHGMAVSSAITRPLSPLDVEAKISQSVIHKEVGCNFEIRPCSPQMMNVELATPVHNVLGERLIEKVVNPIKTKSPICQRIEETNKASSSRSSPKIPSCKMVHQRASPHLNESLKPNYCLQDLESNSGVCLASLPRLDNDIELNFPEINQQFINDNKITSIRDLPILDTDNVEIGYNSTNKINNQPFVIEHLASGYDSDKDVSKLSKYRKQKRYSIHNDNDDTLNMSLNRTDSVIIKNPENAKSHEEHINNVPMNSNKTSSIENIVIDNNKTVNYSDNINPGMIIDENYNDYKLRDNDTAIDFSLNKCDDMQSNSINSLSNLNDSLKNSDDTGSGTIFKSTDKICNQEVSKQVEITPTDDISNLEEKSSTLGDNAYSKVFVDKVALQSIDEDNQIPHAYESVITHFKSKSPLWEDPESHNDLPSLNKDIGDLSTDITASDSVVSENITTALSNDSENQAVICPLVKHSSNIIVPVSEFKNNLGMEFNKHDIVTLTGTDMNNSHDELAIQKCKNEKFETLSALPEGNDNTSNQKLEEVNVISKLVTPNNTDNNIVDRKSDEYVDVIYKCYDENHTSEEQIMAKNVFQPLVDTDRNNTHDDLVIQKSKGENFKTLFTACEGNNDTSIKKLETNMNIVDCRGDDSVDITYKCINENHTKKELTNVCSIDSISHPDNNDLIPLDFDSTDIPCPKMELLDNDDSLFLTNTNKKIPDDLLNDFKISLPIHDKKSCTELIVSDKEPYQIKNEFTFYKNTFSPRIQNLLLYSEGSCTSVTSCLTKSLERQCFQPLEVFKDSDKLQFGELNNDLECKHDIDIAGISDHKITNTSTTVHSKDTSEYGTSIAGDMHCTRTANNVDMINNAEDKINLEGFAAKSCDSECLFEVNKPDKDTYDTHPNNGIEVTDKINSQVEEIKPLQLILDQLSNKRRTLKRSLSESAITDYTAAVVDSKGNYDNNLKCSIKRAKMADSEILVESRIINENYNNFIPCNRRNSVSTIYNDDNVSFCILIDNDYVLTEDNESGPKICYTEIPDDCLTTICTEGDTVNSELTENISYEHSADVCSEEEAVNSELTTDIYYEDNILVGDKEDNNIISELDSEKNSYNEGELWPDENEILLQNMEDRTIEETWVEDVACMETVFSDDIAEDIVISAPSSPKEPESSEDECGNTNIIYNISGNEHTNKVKHIYGNQMCDHDAELVEKLFRTPQMNVNQTLIDRESQLSLDCGRYYDTESLENILSESNTFVQNDPKPDKPFALHKTLTNYVHGNKENLHDPSDKECKQEMYSSVDLSDLIQPELSEEKQIKNYDDCLVHSCESSCDNLVAFKKDEKLQYAISSSPEVSSTTSEEKGPAILLKIRSYKGSKISEVNEMSASFNHTHSHRPLITKAAQKYIPPLKEAAHDLKVKIRLPKQSLYKLQQLKKSKEKPKIDTICSNPYIKNLPQDTIRKAKPKPKFEDVLMSIDQIQFKKHKSNSKKNKPSVPKVIIKKNENGAHYASTQIKETFNPDLTGRKWQPWVFLEKSHFVDKMALKQKLKAVYSHRKKTFVLAENFRKYKSISNAKFVISHPKSNDNISTGNLKYTFRLKHS